MQYVLKRQLGWWIARRADPVLFPAFRAVDRLRVVALDRRVVDSSGDLDVHTGFLADFIHRLFGWPF